MRVVSSRRVIAAVALAASLLAIAVAARPSGAEPTAESMAAVEAAIRRVAAEATPKTVCVRVKMADGHEGFGSGAVISADGFVLTCAHVTEPSKGGKLTAVFPDGAEAALKVVASNAHNDYAVCHLVGERPDLPFFEFAAAEPALGDWVVALGHPGGPFADHKPTIAVGKVTALHRSLPMLMANKEYVGAIQTDAPLFGGNSGGPLVDLEGRLVGINGAILLAGDASFASSAVRIAKDLPSLLAGRNVKGEAIEDVFGAVSELAADVDPDALADAVQNDALKAMFRAMSASGGLGGRDDAKPRAPRRTDELRFAYRAYGETSDVAVVVDGKTVGYATTIGSRDGRGLLLTTARIGRLAGQLELAFDRGGLSPPGPAVARVRGIDGEWDLALLDVEGYASLRSPPHAKPEDTAPGALVFLPGVMTGPRPRGGVIAAVDRAVGTERRIPTLGIVRLFQPPHTSPFRPYPKMIQIDCPLEADELGGPVVRPDGSLVGVAVAHFCGGVTMVVPANVLAASVEKMLQGIDTPAPKTYGPPPRPPPDRARAAARQQEQRHVADSMTLYVPTLAGVLRPARLADPDAGGAGPTAPDDSGVGPLDVRAGDVLLSIDGKPTPSAAAARAAIAALPTDAHVVVVVRRGGAEVRYDATARGDGADRKLALTALAK